MWCRWSPWEVIRSWGWGPHWWDWCPHKREPREHLHSFYVGWRPNTAKKPNQNNNKNPPSSLQSRRRLWPKPLPAGPRSWTLSSGTGRKKCLLLISTSVWSFVIAAQTRAGWETRLSEALNLSLGIQLLWVAGMVLSGLLLKENEYKPPPTLPPLENGGKKRSLHKSSL